jgi:hypothetical protein
VVHTSGTLSRRRYASGSCGPLFLRRWMCCLQEALRPARRLPWLHDCCKGCLPVMRERLPVMREALPACNEGEAVVLMLARFGTLLMGAEHQRISG